MGSILSKIGDFFNSQDDKKDDDKSSFSISNCVESLYIVRKNAELSEYFRKKLKPLLDVFNFNIHHMEEDNRESDVEKDYEVDNDFNDFNDFSSSEEEKEKEEEEKEEEEKEDDVEMEIQSDNEREPSDNEKLSFEEERVLSEIETSNISNMSGDENDYLSTDDSIVDDIVIQDMIMEEEMMGTDVDNFVIIEPE
jgi:hypothetical protein